MTQELITYLFVEADRPDAEAQSIFEADKELHTKLISELYKTQLLRLDPEIPEGFLEWDAASVYPPTANYLINMALRNRDFDIRMIGPPNQESELHDVLQTYVRPDEYERLAKIMFRINHGYQPAEELSGALGNDEDDYTGYRARHILGEPTIGNPEDYKSNAWGQVLVIATGMNTYCEGGRILDPLHPAVDESGLRDSYDLFWDQGVIQRMYMSSLIGHDLRYRNRDNVDMTSYFDMQIYATLKDDGFEPFALEDLIGVAHNSISEVLKEHPEWEPDKNK